jgi:hypothetical protein
MLFEHLVAISPLCFVFGERRDHNRYLFGSGDMAAKRGFNDFFSRPGHGSVMIVKGERRNGAQRCRTRGCIWWARVFAVVWGERPGHLSVTMDRRLIRINRSMGEFHIDPTPLLRSIGM